MSFLDNLESNLKNLESTEEGKADADRQQRTRATETARARAAAPYADELKNGNFTAELLRQATRIGHAQRVKVRVAWLGTTLLLEARERRLELRPTPSGVVAAYVEANREIRTEPLDLNGKAEELVRNWLAA